MSDSQRMMPHYYGDGCPTGHGTVREYITESEISIDADELATKLVALEQEITTQALAWLLLSGRLPIAPGRCAAKLAARAQELAGKVRELSEKLKHPQGAAAEKGEEKKSCNTFEAPIT